jgi:hypothetical protein
MESLCFKYGGELEVVILLYSIENNEPMPSP